MRILDIQKETDFNHVNLFSVHYQDKAGNKRSWVYASRRDTPTAPETERLPDAVVIVPFHVQEKKLVMIREFRVPLGQVQYGFPAGLIDAQETIAGAAARELYEETGLNLLDIHRQSPVVYSSSGLTDESLSLVFVNCAGRPSSKHSSDSEEIETILLSQNEAKHLQEQPDFCFDVKSWLVLSAFAASGSI